LVVRVYPQTKLMAADIGGFFGDERSDILGCKYDSTNARLNDTRFGSDLGLLLASNVAPLIAENNLTEVAQFSQRFYGSTSRYAVYAT